MTTPLEPIFKCVQKEKHHSDLQLIFARLMNQEGQNPSLLNINNTMRQITTPISPLPTSEMGQDDSRPSDQPLQQIEIWNQDDFKVYRNNYMLMLEVLFQNPLISDIFNNVANPSQLEGYSFLMLECLKDHQDLMIENLINELESEFVFVKTQNEPFIFLRERSRLAPRLTGDYINSRMNPVLKYHFKSMLEGIRDPHVDEEAIAQIVFNKIYSAEFINDIPDDVAYLINQVFFLSGVYDFEKYNYMLTGNLIFLRCICPAIAAPEHYNIMAQAPPNDVRKNMIKASKLINYIANSLQENYVFDDAVEDNKEFILKQETPYKAFIDKLRNRTFTYKVMYNTRTLKDISAPEEKMPAYTKQDSETPQEFLTKYLNSIIEMHLGLNPRKYSLRMLGSVHECLVENKTKIYDIIQSIKEYTGEYRSDFANETQEKRFERLLKSYCDYFTLETTQLYNTTALLQQLLSKCPPIINTEIVNRTYKTVKGEYIKHGYNAILIFENDPTKITEQPSNLLEVIEGDGIEAVKLEEHSQGVSIKAANSVFYCFEFENEKMKQQEAAEIVELCYFVTSKPTHFECGFTANAKKGKVYLLKESLLIIEGPKQVCYCQKYEDINDLEEVNGNVINVQGKKAQLDITMNPADGQLFVQLYNGYVEQIRQPAFYQDL